MNKRKLLIVIDMQNDFIDGALGTGEAVGIVEAVNSILLYRHRSQWEKQNEVVISEETILP